MGYRYAILGAGRQGVALAYDLIANGEADELVLADVDATTAERGAARLAELLPAARCPIRALRCDVAEPDQVATVVRGATVVLSAVPYRFNAALTDLAIAAGACFCDLGGNTQVVRHQLARHARAEAAGVIVPDCGLAPGLGNTLAAHGVAAMDEPQRVRVRCGGLPQTPVGPLGYKLVFNFDGLLNEYSGYGEFLRDGRPLQVPALTEQEEIAFPPPVGKCEAAVTSGGSSTCAETFLGHLEAYDYKTVRYPGHFAIVRALFALGCFEERITLPDGATLEPRMLLRRLLETRLAFPEVQDVVVLRCTVIGRHHGRPCRRQYDLFDRHDERTGFAAMERTTAFPAALVAHMQARSLVPPGARPLETTLPAQQYLDELPRHDIRIDVAVTP
ncbi:MAG TPA: saccharopine dehydrogenase C-terminal domain-containing protein [Phycisphaerae bacterium]|nr:saccharopine dehydrogenase C-terminal domain-containing protein [Phycisphaerae bacterium]HNU46676.1 saccharopine dehydrogenase C-terminal domain-containing protein [Phycisphaerae bacterium]